MLEFELTKDHYTIYEITFGWYADYVKVIRYTKDLKMIQVDNDMWRKTDKVQRMWFEAHYRNAFCDIARMGLKFKICDSWYEIIDDSREFFAEGNKVVRYSLDLNFIQVDEEPWEPSDRFQRKSFEKYYREEFNKLEESRNESE